MKLIKKLVAHTMPIIYKQLPVPGWMVKEINKKIRYDFREIKFPKIIFCRNKIPVIIKNPNDLIQQELFFRGYFEYKETKLIEKMVGENSIFLDIGANIGWHSLIALSRNAKVLSFEPVVSTYNHLQENIALSGKHNVLLFPFALSDSNGKVPIYATSKNNDGSNSFFTENPNSDHIEIIETRIGDEVLDTKEIVEIDFCKIDVEGAEIKVLKGLHKTLKTKRIKNIMIELNEEALRRGGGSGLELVNLLKELGYKINDIKYNEPINLNKLPLQANLICHF